MCITGLKKTPCLFKTLPKIELDEIYWYIKEKSKNKNKRKHLHNDDGEPETENVGWC